MQTYRILGCLDNFFNGKKCVYCGSFKVCRTQRGYIKCNLCGRQKGSHLLRRELKIITGFYQQQPAYRMARDLGINYKTVTRVYQRLREAIYHVSELEAGRLKGEIELDEAYFGGRRKGKRGRGAAGKSLVFGLLERNGRVYTRVVESVTADELMSHIREKTRKGSVYFTDTFRSYRSLKRWGKHHMISHGKRFPKTKNHINGIEGFWSYAKHVLYNYRGVSKYHFPMYLKEVEYRFNHRDDNLLKLFVNIYFSYVST
jgi:transposase